MQTLMIAGRVLATILCGPMLIVGCIWILQGINMLPGSFMTGDIKWAVFGAILALLGAGLVFWLNRRPAPR
jgi:membrane associated rhomboid family serine protease